MAAAHNLRCIALLSVPWIVACDGASSELGFDATLIVEGAQHVPEALPGDQGGPAVIVAALDHSALLRGRSGERLSGTLGATATAVALAWPDDNAYWIVPASAPRAEEPDLPAFEARLSIAHHAPLVETEIVVRAVDAEGRFGRSERIPVTIIDAIDDAILRVSLRWDTDADLDLHVVTPESIEIWSGNPNSYRPPTPGQPPADPTAFRQGGMLDFDSNAACVIDGRRHENVVYRVQPPSGEYRVLVASPSLCDQPVAHFRVDAWLDGESIGTSEGLRISADQRESEHAGAGLFALSFEVP